MSMFLALVCEYMYIIVCLVAMSYLWQQELDIKVGKYVIIILIIFITLLTEKKMNMEELLTYPIEILCVLLLLKDNMVQNFMRFLMTDLMLGIMQKMVAYLAISLGFTTYEYTENRGIERLLIYIWMLLIILLIGKKFNQYAVYLRKLTWYHMVLCIAVEICLAFIIIQAELGMFFNAKEIANNVTMGLVLLVCLLVLAVILVFIIVDINRKHYQEQNKLKDDFLKIQEKYYKTVANKDEEVRKVRHDLKAHLGCIEILLEERNYQEAEKYIRELKNDTVKRIDTTFKSGNDIINAVLNDVADVAMRHNTRIVVTGILPSNIKIQSPELCSLFYNLLSNSEEAMKQYEGKLPREIIVEISNYKRSVGIAIKNPVEKPVEISRLGKYTSKQDKKYHGYGIENVKAVVDKYKGLIDYENEDGYFVCKITFVNILNW